MIANAEPGVGHMALPVQVHPATHLAQLFVAARVLDRASVPLCVVVGLFVNGKEAFPEQVKSGWEIVARLQYEADCMQGRHYLLAEMSDAQVADRWP
jgi:hypothetical protein